jgi:YggT family protein
MIILSIFINAIASILDMAITLYIWIIIAYSIISWIRIDSYNPIVQLIIRLVEPSFILLRKYIPTSIGSIDLAPIIIIFFLQFLKLFLIKMLFIYSAQLV